MHIIVKALPCLLFVAWSAHAESVPSSVASMRDPDRGMPGAALDVVPASGTVQSPLRMDGRMVAAKKKRTKGVAAAAAGGAVSKPHDPSNRFNMTQNGKRMTADDFDAWMKAHGYRVAKGGAAPQQGSD